jgi:hypothetical protein
MTDATELAALAAEIRNFADVADHCDITHICNTTISMRAWAERLDALASRDGGGLEIPEGWVLVPREPTDAMLDAGRTAVMARDCSSAKWSPAQHYAACGTSTEGIPADELAGYHSIIPKEQGATLVWFAMLAAAKAAPLPGAVEG